MIIPAYPALNIYSFSARRTTALGPVCIATVVNKTAGWDTEVIDENNLRRHGPRAKGGGADHALLQEQRPADIVGLYGGLTSTIPRLYEIARFYKGRGIVTIAGGQHFSKDTIPEALSSGVDYVVIGEGEETITEFLESLEGKRDIQTVKGIAYRKDGNVVFTQTRAPITDFDMLPLPDFSLVRYAKIINYPVERIRGCGMDCEFCTVKGTPRNASPERLLERISFLVETQGAKKFFIVDDLFGQHRNDTIRFCNMVRDYQKNIGTRLSLGVQIRLDKAGDTALLCAMKEANIKSVFIGLESPIAAELTAMKKRLKPEDMISLIRIFHKFGFFIHGMFIFGYPLEKGAAVPMQAAERVRHYQRFIKKAKLDTIQVLMPVPLPGTKLRDRLKKDSRLYPIEDVGWEYYDGNFPLFEPDKPMTAENMQFSTWKIMRKFYEFKYLFMIFLSVFSFAGMIFFLHNIKGGWKRWHRYWHNYLVRFSGWVILRKWKTASEKDIFAQKLLKAKNRLSSSASCETRPAW